MIDLLRTVLDQAGEHVVLLLACVLLFAIIDAALRLERYTIPSAAVHAAAGAGWLMMRRRQRSRA